MGYAITEKIIAEREQFGDYKDLVDLISRTNKFGLNKRGLESLILSGALDSFGKNRTQLMAVFELVLERTSKDRKQEATGQISMFSTLLKNEQTLTSVDYPDIPEYIETEKLKKEKEIVGVYVSGHPLDKFLNRFDQYTFNSSMIKKDAENTDEDGEVIEQEEDEQVSDIYDGMPVTFGGIITEFKKTFTRRDNKEMAIIKVEDLYGDIDCLVFPNAYKNLKPLLEVDKIAVFSGKISIRSGEAPAVLIDDVQELNSASNQNLQNNTSAVNNLNAKKILYLRFDANDKDTMNKVSKILDNYNGDIECRIVAPATKTVFVYEHPIMVNNLLMYELQTVLDEKDIKLI